MKELLRQLKNEIDPIIRKQIADQILVLAQATYDRFNTLKSKQSKIREIINQYDGRFSVLFGSRSK